MDILSLLYVLSSTRCSSSTLTLEVLFLCEVLWYFMAEPDKTRFPFASVLARVLQRSRTNRIYVCMHACVCIQVYYKELVQTIMDAEIIRSVVSKFETQGNWCSSCPNLKAWEPETMMVGSPSKNWQVWHPKRADVLVLVQKQEKTDKAAHGRLERKSFLSLTGVSEFFLPLRPSAGWLMLTHMREGQLCSSIYWLKHESHPQPHSQTHTPRTMFDQMSGSLWSSQDDP